MSTTVQLESIVDGPAFVGGDNPDIHTTTIYVVHTGVDDTLAALRVACGFARELDVPVTLVDVRPVPYALPVDAPAGISAVEAEEFGERLRAEGLEARVHVCLCRDARSAIPSAFRPRSMVVVAGRRRWWPTRAIWWRRTLEAAGHFVVFVKTSHRSLNQSKAKDASHA